MTKKDYEFFVRVFRLGIHEFEKRENPDNIEMESKIVGHVLRTFAYYFKIDNERFDEVRFFKAISKGWDSVNLD